MHVVALLMLLGSAGNVSSQSIGTAQVLTFGLMLGAFGALVFLSLFVYRSGHEKAHRQQILREQRREELAHERPKQLEMIHEHPSVEEELPR